MRKLTEIGTATYQVRDLLAALSGGQPLGETSRVSPKQFFRTQRLVRKTVQQELGGTFEYRWMQAHSGDADAQVALGKMYARGVGTRQSDGEAIRWYHQAAEKGQAAAQFYLGHAYFYGRGVPQNRAAGMKWFQLSAENGNPEAQYRLASILDFEQVEGIPLNYADAAKWYRLAADQGHIEAQHRLGSIYATGRGMAQNDVLAHMWFEIAAKRGHAPSRRSLQVIAKLMGPDEINEARRMVDGRKPTAARLQEQTERGSISVAILGAG